VRSQYLQHTATQSATHCNTLQHTAPHCTTLQRTVFWECLPVFPTKKCAGSIFATLATHCNTHCTILHHTVPHCNTLSFGNAHQFFSRRNMWARDLHHTATTLQHTATHCLLGMLTSRSEEEICRLKIFNTLQHTVQHTAPHFPTRPHTVFLEC